ncbi:DUF6912 family protein [Luteipulveratus halotolerans]|uniref:Uncharacterized protein n=1 Tax=Luteipulveratus halotolerans TaxID=1631356 RepID=A0A0L6CJC7_9MICO|nr:hypothetical protein [Luteipulveratus halotolerans]KNX37715.1 hypothetical protein VV01_12080 [Luteipulveratus halotolerans]
MNTTTRVYLPVTADDLAALDERRELPGPTREAYAVTAAVLRAQPHEDPEVLEYGALQDAALASGAGGVRIVVAAADLEQPVVREPDEGIETAVVVDGAVALPRIVSLHVGDVGADTSGEEDVELSWYDVTEIALVRAELAR